MDAAWLAQGYKAGFSSRTAKLAAIWVTRRALGRPVVSSSAPAVPATFGELKALLSRRTGRHLTPILRFGSAVGRSPLRRADHSFGSGRLRYCPARRPGGGGGCCRAGRPGHRLAARMSSGRSWMRAQASRWPPAWQWALAPPGVVNRSVLGQAGLLLPELAPAGWDDLVFGSGILRWSAALLAHSPVGLNRRRGRWRR